MKRLTELPAGDELTARAHVLVRTLGPTVESEARLQRVRRNLDAPRSTARPRLLGRAAAVAVVVGVSALAVAGSRLSPWHRAPVASRVAPVSTTQGGSAPPQRRPSGPVVTPAEPPETPEPPIPPPTAATAVPPRVRVTAPSTDESDVARVHAAAKALRHDRDPARALQLLEGAGRPIAGPLAEEALALRIQAAAMRNDGRAHKLAVAYLAQYPHGHYRAMAHQVLAGSEP